ncbi:MAG: tripartite tricarboxylate transporter substrate binding protein [Pseudomonadota bacterium]
MKSSDTGRAGAGDGGRSLARRAWLRSMLCLGSAGTVEAGLPSLVWAQDAAPWSPRGPVRIVVPFAAGGSSDLIARVLAVRLTEALQQPVVVENKLGAGGNIGIASVGNAAPDGLSLLMVSSAFVTNPALYPDKPPYDPVKQFAPISLAVSSPDVIAVRTASPLKTLADLVALAKSKPGGLNYSTPGKGNSSHLGGELLWQRAGVQLVHVPYNGAAPAVLAALSEQVDCALVSLPSAKAQIAGGTLRALSVGGDKRWPEFPAVPTVAEQGYAGYRSETMQALFAPAGTPPAAIDRLGREVRRILQDPAVQQQTRDMGFETVASLPAALGARVAEEAPRWRAVAAQAHIRAD